MPPCVGVVVPCKDEIATIEKCLRSIRGQVPAVTRIVVVDNGSTDGSLDVARRLADEVLELPQARIGQMRNAGAERCADLDVLAFVDADCELEPGWLGAALHALETADLVGSRTFADAAAPWVAKRWAAIEAAQQHAGSLVWSQHLAIRASVFASLGGFDEALVTREDVDLSQRVRTGGGAVRLVPEMRVVHHGFPGTVSAFVRRERWHTGKPGWFAPMSAKSRGLVLGAAGWGVTTGVVAVAAAASGDARLAAAWGAGSVAGMAALGAVAGHSPKHAFPDGILMSLWALNRAVRLPRELGAAR